MINRPDWRLALQADHIKRLEEKLKIKEQECERLKARLKPKLKNAHCVYFEGQTGICKAKEFTKCNPINCKLYTIDELSMIVDLQTQLDQLKKEKETLKQYKASKQASYESMQREWNKVEQENRKLSKTLAEIKEIALKSNFTPCLDVDCDCKNCHDDITENGSRCMQYGLEKIIKIIIGVEE